MEDQTTAAENTAALLIQDLEANILFLQVGAFALTIILALIGLTLAMRAYTVLSEARALYWQASAGPSRPSENNARAVRAAAIRASQSRRKNSARKNRTVI